VKGDAVAKRQARKCSAHCADGGPCANYAVRGATVCGVHGGRAPQVKAAAEQRILDERAAAELARLDAPPVGNPLEELARLAGQAVAWKDAMAGKVNQLNDAVRFESKLGQEQLRSELLLWERALDRCTNVLVAMAKLRIDERLAAIEERKTEIVAAAVREALARSGATEEQQLEAKQHVVLRLRAIDGGKEFARAR
jgi:hypothetical protein